MGSFISIARNLFAPTAPVEHAFASADEMRRTYRYWRIRQLYTSFIGYAVYYLVRKNFSMAIPDMKRSLGYNDETIGKFLTVQDVVYGISKFANGMLGDRTNPRYFMALGLVLSGVVNFFLGLVSLPLTMLILLVFNGWFQGMGFPPCARVLSHWFSPGERGMMWGLWNTSHQVGLASTFILGGYLARFMGWRAVFVVPAMIAMAVAFLLVERLRDTPGSLGLPPVETYTGEDAGLADIAVTDEVEPPPVFRAILWDRVFSNPYIWIICLANFFVYVIRYVFLNWAPMYLREVKGVQIDEAGWTMAFFEVAGIPGSILAGWLSDRLFHTRRAPVCVMFMLATAGAIAALWHLPPGARQWQVNLDLWAVGFLIYGPQFLVGVMTADLATKQAAATAIGLTGFFGYLSGLLSGWGMGAILQRHGWDAGFRLLVGCSLLGAVLFALCWRATARHATPHDE